MGGAAAGHCGQTAQAGQTSGAGSLIVAQAASKTTTKLPLQSRKERQGNANEKKRTGEIASFRTKQTMPVFSTIRLGFRVSGKAVFIICLLVWLLDMVWLK